MLPTDKEEKIVGVFAAGDEHVVQEEYNSGRTDDDQVQQQVDD